jgi:hypothetical protein
LQRERERVKEKVHFETQNPVQINERLSLGRTSLEVPDSLGAMTELMRDKHDQGGTEKVPVDKLHNLQPLDSSNRKDKETLGG